MSDATPRAPTVMTVALALSLGAMAIAAAALIVARRGSQVGGKPLASVAREHTPRSTTIELTAGESAQFGDLTLSIGVILDGRPLDTALDLLDLTVETRFTTRSLVFHAGQETIFEDYRIRVNSIAPAESAGGRARFEGSAEIYIDRIVRPRRRVVLRLGQRFDFMGLRVEVTGMSLASPEDLADDRVELLQRLNGESIALWNSEGGKNTMGPFTIRIETVTPFNPPGDPEGAPVLEGEVVLEIFRDPVEVDSGRRPIG